MTSVVNRSCPLWFLPFLVRNLPLQDKPQSLFVDTAGNFASFPLITTHAIWLALVRQSAISPLPDVATVRLANAVPDGE